MTLERTQEITDAMRSKPLSWMLRWCDAEECGCLGCVNGSVNIQITKAEWQEWWRIHGVLLGGVEQ